MWLQLDLVVTNLDNYSKPANKQQFLLIWKELHIKFRAGLCIKVTCWLKATTRKKYGLFHKLLTKSQPKFYPAAIHLQVCSITHLYMIHALEHCYYLVSCLFFYLVNISQASQNFCQHIHPECTFASFKSL